MAKRKRRKVPAAVKAITPAIGVGVAGVITGAMAGPTSALLPAGVVNPLGQVSAAASRFAGPIGVIGLTGLSVKELRKLKKI